jgi:hypothetical protein
MHSMASFHYNQEADAGTGAIALWYCEECNAFHIKVGPMTLTFEGHEFASFLDLATDAYWEQALRGKVQMPGLALRPINLMKEPSEQHPLDERGNALLRD